MPKIEQACERCGATFLAYASQHRHFCSQRCNAIHREGNRTVPQTDYHCQECGRAFQRSAAKARYQEARKTPPKYCSATCRGRAALRAQGRHPSPVAPILPDRLVRRNLFLTAAASAWLDEQTSAPGTPSPGAYISRLLEAEADRNSDETRGVQW